MFAPQGEMALSQWGSNRGVVHDTCVGDPLLGLGFVFH